MYLKVLSEENRACHGGLFDFTPYLPVGDEPGKPLPERKVRLCESGWHWCMPESLMQTWAKAGMRVYEAEPSSDATAPDGDGKSVSSSGRLLRAYALPEWWLNTMRFIDTVSDVPSFQQVTAPDPAWRYFEGKTLAAARDAAWDAAAAAAGVAAWAAARDAARDAAAAAARDAARDAAAAAARDAAAAAAGVAAWAAAWAAARDAAWDAARDARLMARMLVCADLDIEQRHRDHAAARWNVWQCGYGVVGDVDGVLYVNGVTGMGDLSVGPDVALP